MTQFLWVVYVWCGTFSTWHLHGNQVSKTRFTSKNITKKTTTTTTAKKTTTTTATTIPGNMCSSEKKEKKEEKKTRNRGCSERTQVVRCYLGRARRPGSRGGLDLARLDRRAHLHFFFFFFSSLSFSLFFLSFRVFLLFLHLGSLIIIIFGLEIES